jgi:dipeptidase E
MKLLLTSAGVKNQSIMDALVDMLGKPIAETNALCIPTASYGHKGGWFRAYDFIHGTASPPMTELGWQSLGVLELSTLPTLGKEYWVPFVEEADIVLVNGGDPMYLYYWIRESGLEEMLPSLLENMVWMGLSAGSLVMAPNVGTDFVSWPIPGGGDETLGIVDFAICPHLDHPNMPENTMADAEEWASRMTIPCYAIDDATAIRVVDGVVDVISEGHWKLFNA